jgi:hypothetical protein
MMDFRQFQNSIASPALQAVVAHWHEARGSAAMPRWEQLRPARIAKHLSLVWAYKYEEGQFFGRLAGGRITRAFDKNFRGLPLSQALQPHVAARSHALMSRIISEPVIYRCTGNLFRHGNRVIEGERIALPLAGEGIMGGGVLGASAYHYPDYNADDGPVELILDSAEWFSLTPAAGTA